MTLGKLKDELKTFGIYSIGSMGIGEAGNKPKAVTVYFSTDPAPMFPFPVKNLYPLVTKTGEDNEVIHREKIKALKRTLIPDWDEE